MAVRLPMPRLEPVDDRRLAGQAGFILPLHELSSVPVMY